MATDARWIRWPAGQDHAQFGYGADYNPEQWPRETWAEDVRLMREAGVTIVTVGVFSWARLQLAPDTWDFAWLDEVMDLLHANGIAVDLATATASPPPWLTTLHPEILPVTADGVTLSPGSRQHWRPASPVFRRYALALVEAMAARYGEHPALAAWHVSNELGCHNVHDYSDDAAHAFRDWLRERYGTVAELNRAWGTAFWSQAYSDFAEVLPPRRAATHPNPTQQLDFKRFSSWVLQDYLRAERDVLRRLTPDVPVTTNFMLIGHNGMDYAAWADDVDFVANDHYRLVVERPEDDLSLAANLTSNLAEGRPWFLMEHATSAVNWAEINPVKSPADLLHDALVHVGHGADAVCYFQWRQSRAGAEKYHSAMVPHAGADTDTYRAVVQLGGLLRDLRQVVGSRRAPARVAIVVDWESWWAVELDSHPSSHVDYRREVLEWYGALLDAGVRVDVVPVRAELSGYDVVVAPLLYLMPGALAERLRAFVARGGHLVTTYFSGIVDTHDHVHLGGYPGALRDLLGIRVAEFMPLLADQQVELDNGTRGTLWSEPVEITDPAAKAVVCYASGLLAGRPAVTRCQQGSGSATYVSTRLGIEGIAALLPEILGPAGVDAEPTSADGKVETMVRTDGTTEYVFLANRTADAVEVPVGEERVLLGEVSARGGLALAPHGVGVLVRPA